MSGCVPWRSPPMVEAAQGEAGEALAGARPALGAGARGSDAHGLGGLDERRGGDRRRLHRSRPTSPPVARAATAVEAHRRRLRSGRRRYMRIGGARALRRQPMRWRGEADRRSDAPGRRARGLTAAGSGCHGRSGGARRGAPTRARLRRRSAPAGRRRRATLDSAPGYWPRSWSRARRSPPRQILTGAPDQLLGAPHRSVRHGGSRRRERPAPEPARADPAMAGRRGACASCAPPGATSACRWTVVAADWACSGSTASSGTTIASTSLPSIGLR